MASLRLTINSYMYMQSSNIACIQSYPSLPLRRVLVFRSPCSSVLRFLSILSSVNSFFPPSLLSSSSIFFYFSFFFLLLFFWIPPFALLSFCGEIGDLFLQARMKVSTASRVVHLHHPSLNSRLTTAPFILPYLQCYCGQSESLRTGAGPMLLGPLPAKFMLLVASYMQTSPGLAPT
ncbi:hypothetical protein GGI35DRAFT_249866 [Trichoderma velutinum]